MKINVCMVAETKPDFVSRQIMERIGAPYSHAAIIYKDLVYHCIERGVCVQNLADGLHHSKIVVSKEVELNCTEDAFFAFMQGALDKDYSELQLVGFIFPKMAKYVADGRSELICSEFVAWVLVELAGYKFSEELDFVDPRELFESLK